MTQIIDISIYLPQVWSLLSSSSLVRVELPAWLDQHTRSAILSYLGPSPATQTCPLTGAS